MIEPQVKNHALGGGARVSLRKSNSDRETQEIAAAYGRRTLLQRGVSLLLATTAATLDLPVYASDQAPSSPAERMQNWFPGFEAFRIATPEATISGVKGGHGPPLLLLHGYPESHLEWHRVAAALAQHFTVVLTDLRGYGDSSVPPDGDSHEGYSKRSMARDQVAVMQHLGFGRFAVVGHDRGGRVAHRLALDFPHAVSRLVVLDIVPTYTVFSTVTDATASGYYFWFLMKQMAPLPETLIGNSADYFLRDGLFRGFIPKFIPEEIYAQYLHRFQTPARQHAMCEDFRASATVDLEHDKADLHVKLQCPLLVLWSPTGAAALYDVLSSWRARAAKVSGKPLPGGHWIPEQLPDELTAEVLTFMS
jgi:haloacetate dehalogenase